MKIHAILKEYWGFNEFRPLQEEIINSIVEGKDTLALLPTGGGKSICFQVPGMAMDGMCLVISPLIALMKDQVENLSKIGINAGAIYSGMHRSEINLLLNNCVHGGIKFLYISPERLSTPEFRDALGQMKISLLAIDEAHCISQWGFDFRPEYRKIIEIREQLPNVPIIALTATATEKVVEDIQEQLGFKKKNVFKKSFERLNLSYIVRYSENKLEKILESFQRLGGSGLVYVRNRKKCEEIANYLTKNGINASFYHAGLDAESRQIRQQNWIENRTKVMVCTNAFGMGIDKPDCKLVIHYEIPDCLEAYYQEAGRAGRDGKKSYCLLLFQSGDAEVLRHKLELNYPNEPFLKQIYESICNFYKIPLGEIQQNAAAFDITEFSSHFSLSPLQVLSAIKVLSQLDILYTNEGFYQSSKLQMLWQGNDVFEKNNLSSFQQEIIQQILRMYGGIYDNPVAISEKKIAMKLNISENDLVSVLKKLDDLMAIKYTPSTNQPLLQIKGERVLSKYLRLNPQFIQDRKKLEVEKLEAMINYAKNKQVCRSRALLAYFNETNANNCGVCDICLEKDNSYWTEERLKSFKSSIENLNWERPISIKQLAVKLNFHHESHLTQAIRILMDKGILQLNSEQELIWTKES